MKAFNRVLLTLTSLLLLGAPVSQADNHRIPMPRIPIPESYPTIPTPDLVVQRLVKNGPAVVVSRNGNIRVPIRVTVKNRGSYKAAPFMVSAHDATDGRDYVIPLYSGDNRWYRRTELASGRSETLTGILTFSSKLRGQRVRVKVKADSCAGEEFMPHYCRVNERDENNNWSSLLTIALP